MTTPEPTLNTVLPVYCITSGYYAGMSGVLQRYSVGIRCICKYVQYQVPVIILEFLPALTIHSTHLNTYPVLVLILCRKFLFIQGHSVVVSRR